MVQPVVVGITPGRAAMKKKVKVPPQPPAGRPQTKAPKGGAHPKGVPPLFFLDGPPLGGTAYRHMNSDPQSPQPPPASVELAQALAADAAERGMLYEEFSFEIEDGPEDGCEYKVLVMRI